MSRGVITDTFRPRTARNVRDHGRSDPARLSQGWFLACPLRSALFSGPRQRRRCMDAPPIPRHAMGGTPIHGQLAAATPVTTDDQSRPLQHFRYIRHLRDPASEERPLGRIVGQLQRVLIRPERLGPAAEPAQQVPFGRRQGRVAAQPPVLLKPCDPPPPTPLPPPPPPPSTPST